MSDYNAWEQQLAGQGGQQPQQPGQQPPRGGAGGAGGAPGWNAGAAAFIPSFEAPAFNPGGYGGYPQQGYGGYPQQGYGGYPQQGYYPQGGYQQGGYQQGGYQQGGYQQGGYQQGGGQRGGYGGGQRGGYQQQQHQGGYHQGGRGSGGHHQGGRGGPAAGAPAPAPAPAAAGGPAKVISISTKPAEQQQQQPAAASGPAKVISISTKPAEPAGPAKVISISTKPAEPAGPAKVISISTKPAESAPAAGPAKVISISTKPAEPAAATAAKPAAKAEKEAAVSKDKEAPESWEGEDEEGKPAAVAAATSSKGDAVKEVTQKTEKLSVAAPAATEAKANAPAAVAAAAAPAAEEEEEEEEDDSAEIEVKDHREHVNVIFIGHVDAGKSTIGGHLMFLTGGVDQRTMEKYEREAKEKNRESWYLSWALDTSEEERNKGKTHECGRGHFTTEKRHYTIIDAPGHKCFVPNMISGIAQADIGILVISARRGEFETGFDKGGQTREHAMLAKTAGVKHLVVVINKMDDETVNWEQARFDECKDKLMPFLKQTGFNLKTEVTFIPISGLKGYNLVKRTPEGICPFYDGPSLVEFLDSMPKIVRMLDAPVRIPITDKFRDMGMYVSGKLEAGKIKPGQKLVVMPNRHPVIIDSILMDDEEVESAVSGDNIKLRLKNCEETDVSAGYVLCPPKYPCHVGRVFDAQIVIVDYKSIMCAGYTSVMHVHTATENATLKGIICMVDKKTGKPDKEKGRPRFMKQGDVCIARYELGEMTCLETFKDHPQMGRFTLRDEGKTVAVGKILKVIDSTLEADTAAAAAATGAAPAAPGATPAATEEAE